MDDKKLVDRLREALKYDGYNRMVADIIEELDPPRPAPGTVVWWRRGPQDNWILGIVDGESYGVMHMTGLVPFDDVEYKPARILAPDKVALEYISNSYIRGPSLIHEYCEDMEKLRYILEGREATE